MVVDITDHTVLVECATTNRALILSTARFILKYVLFGYLSRDKKCVVSTLSGWKGGFRNKKPPVVPGDIFDTDPYN
jgi:hypothetical protein